MKRQPYSRFSTHLLLAALAWTSASQGGVIYQYRDQQGAMAFSDSPPAHTNDYIVIEMPDAPPPPDDAGEREVAADSIEEMIAVTERLEAARREREEAGRQQQAQRQPEPAMQSYQEPRDQGPGYLLPGHFWPYPVRPRPTPPYSFNQPQNAADKRLQELKTPLRIPQFGSGQSLREQIEPFSPPQRAPQRR